MDTGGSYEFPAMKTLNIASSNAFILVYSIEDESSFDEVSSDMIRYMRQFNKQNVTVSFLPPYHFMAHGMAYSYTDHILHTYDPHLAVNCSSNSAFEKEFYFSLFVSPDPDITQPSSSI